MNHSKERAAVFPWIFPLILLAYAVYAAIFIYKTSFIIDGQRYFVLFDDAMISMRYAKNLADGYGLVWNPGGERVEGYTNPLWVVFMAVFHLLPIPASKASLPVQISGAVFMLASLVYVRKIADQVTGRPAVGLLAVVLTAFYSSLNNWALLGMEVSALTLILCLALWLVLKNLQDGRFSSWPYWLLAMSTLIRIDMAVPFLVILGFLVLADPDNRRRHLLWGAGLLLAFLAGQTLFRLSYYGSPLPNTYYLKMVGYPLLLRVARGLYVFSQFVFAMNWLLFLLPLVVLLYRRDRSIILLFLVFLGQVAYSIYVGGDAWEHVGGANRYFAIVMPMFFILFVYGVDLVRETLVARANLHSPSSLNPALSAVEGPALSAVEGPALSTVEGPALSTVEGPALSTVEGPALSTVEGPALSTVEGPALSLSKGQALSGLVLVLFVLAAMINFNFFEKNKSLLRWALLRQPSFVEGNIENTQIGLDLNRITTPEARIAVVTAGAVPYFADRYSIDLLGKSDPVIAHQKVHLSGGIFDPEKFRPGHMKWDYPYSIGQLKPDVVAQLWGNTQEAKPFLNEYVAGGTGEGNIYSLRIDSPYIRWDRVAQNAGSE